MDVDEDDDFYGEEESGQVASSTVKPEEAQSTAIKPEKDEDLEEGEEEDEDESDDSDSDIDIIIERKEGSAPAPPAQPKYNEIRNIPQRKGSSDVITKLPAVKKEATTKGPKLASGADLPGVSTSKIDVNAKPMYEPAGKLITQVNIDEDLGESEKPWRRPGTDVSDYFNYGFDEFTWALYASKQDGLRAEYSQEKVALNNKKMMEDLNMMMMGGMPGMMPGAPSGGLPGADGMPPEMQAMMQQMMASGMDPSQMDPAAMFAGMQGNQSGAGGAGAGQGGFGQGQNQQMGYGFDQNMNSGGGNNRGGFGRGRGRGRGW